MADNRTKTMNFRPTPEQESYLLAMPKGERSGYIRRALDVYQGNLTTEQLNRIEQKLDLLLVLAQNGHITAQTFTITEQQHTNQNDSPTDGLPEVDPEYEKEKEIDEAMAYFANSLV